MSGSWLSVVIPLRDDPSGIRRTLRSIREQSLDGVEVLIIDSSCNRADAQRLAADIAHISWMPAEGVFPAMNAGLAEAQGKYIHFLTSGDAYFDRTILARIREAIRASPDWLFGPVEIVNEQGKPVVTPSWDYWREAKHFFSRGLFPQHQGTIVKRDLLLQLGGFSTRYEIAADYELFLRLSMNHPPELLDFIVARFHEGGVSTVRWRQSFREFHQARKSVFQLKGRAHWREAWHSKVHYVRVWLYREIILRRARLLRR